MKKIFTLVAMAMMAVGVNAQSTEDITSKFNYFWGQGESISNQDGNVVYNAAAWGGLAAWFGVSETQGSDLSAWDRIVVEFAEPITCSAVIKGLDPTSNAATEGNANAGSTSIEAPLGEKGKNISQFALQFENACTVVITKIYLANDAPTESSVLWEGECAFGNWANGASIDAAKFANIAEGDGLLFTFTTDESNPNTWWQIKTNCKDVPLTSNATELNEWDVVSFSQGATSYKITLNATDVANLKEAGLYVGGYYLILTKVEQVKTVTGINTVAKTAAVQNGARYNLAGQLVDEGYKGLVIMNGKKVVIK